MAMAFKIIDFISLNYLPTPHDSVSLIFVSEKCELT